MESKRQNCDSVSLIFVFLDSTLEDKNVGDYGGSDSLNVRFY
jgi:hypothetical protein